MGMVQVLHRAADKAYMLRELDNAAWQELLFLGLGLNINGIFHFLQDGCSHLIQAAGEGFMLYEERLCFPPLCQCN